MMKKTMIAAALVAASLPAHAGQGMFVQADFGVARTSLTFDIGSSNDDFRSTRSSAAIGAGYQFDDHLSVVLQHVRPGDVSMEADSSYECGEFGCGTYTFDTRSNITLTSMVGQYLFGNEADNWVFLARAGVVSVKHSVVSEGWYNGTLFEKMKFEDSPIGGTTGVTLQHNYTDRLALLANADMYLFRSEFAVQGSNSGVDGIISRFSIGVKYTF